MTTHTWPQVPPYSGGTRGERACWPAGTLPAIEWEPAPITPLPEVIELPPGEGWLMWDAAVAMRDLQSHAGKVAA